MVTVGVEARCQLLVSGHRSPFSLTICQEGERVPGHPSRSACQEVIAGPMFTAYVIVAVMAITANAVIAAADFTRAGFVLANSAKVGVPESWLTPLGVLKAAGAGGLLLGLVGVPLIGEAAAIGLILFFVGAVITHLRAREYSLGFPLMYLLLAMAALVLFFAT
jgi:DoxX-like family